MHPTLKSKPAPVFLLTPNSLLTGRTDRSLSAGFKEAEMPSMTADVGTLQSHLCFFTLHHFSFIFTLTFSFAQVIKINGSMWGPSDDEEARSELKHTFTGTQMHILYPPLPVLDIYKSWGIKKKKALLHQETHVKMAGCLLQVHHFQTNMGSSFAEMALIIPNVHNGTLCITTTHIPFQNSTAQSDDSGKRGSNSQTILSRQNPNV